MNIKVYRPDGSTRAIWSKSFARVNRQHRVMPLRASCVIAITEGKFTGMFHVDFSPLADLTKKENLHVCLTQTFETKGGGGESKRSLLLQKLVPGKIIRTKKVKKRKQKNPPPPKKNFTPP